MSPSAHSKRLGQSRHADAFSQKAYPASSALIHHSPTFMTVSFSAYDKVRARMIYSVLRRFVDQLSL